MVLSAESFWFCPGLAAVPETLMCSEVPWSLYTEERSGWRVSWGNVVRGAWYLSPVCSGAVCLPGKTSAWWRRSSRPRRSSTSSTTSAGCSSCPLWSCSCGPRMSSDGGTGHGWVILWNTNVTRIDVYGGYFLVSVGNSGIHFSCKLHTFFFSLHFEQWDHCFSFSRQYLHKRPHFRVK